jgi:hypothetical protein
VTSRVIMMIGTSRVEAGVALVALGLVVLSGHVVGSPCSSGVFNTALLLPDGGV